MDVDAALELIRSAIAGVDEYHRACQRESKRYSIYGESDWDSVRAVESASVIPRLELARQIAEASGHGGLQIVAPPARSMYNDTPYQANRDALVVLETRLAESERMAAILGPRGPQLSTASLHPTVWRAAAHLFDGGHYRQAVQTAGQALESHLQTIAGPQWSGIELAQLFRDVGKGSEPNHHFDFLDPDGDTYVSARQGAAFLIRGAMQAVRNLVSHPEWPEPGEVEALEMLAVLSYVAHLVDRSAAIDRSSTGPQ